MTFSFQVTRNGHPNGDSWNEFRDLKSSRNIIKIIAVGYIQAEIKKSQVDHNVTFSFKVTREGHAFGNSWNDFFDLKNLGNKKKFITLAQLQPELETMPWNMTPLTSSMTSSVSRDKFQTVGPHTNTKNYILNGYPNLSDWLYASGKDIFYS